MSITSHRALAAGKARRLQSPGTFRQARIGGVCHDITTQILVIYILETLG